MSKIVTNIEFLRQISEPVVSVEEATGLIRDLESNLKLLPNGIGLAAIQIGIPKKVAVIKVEDKFIYLINSELIEGEDEFVFLSEGCLSIPNFVRDTKRYGQVFIKNYRIDGDKLEEEKVVFYCDQKSKNNEMIETVAVQHELDHFSGKLIIDKEKIENIPIRTNKKAGRNDPCPCGSGKKYKKCCGK